MSDLINIFRMTELSVGTRIKIIKRLGVCLNHQYGANLTEALVYELVIALDPENPIKNDENYLYFVRAGEEVKGE